MTLTRVVAAILVLAVSAAVSAATFTVSSGAATGPGTLEQAILDANGSPGRDAIRFTVTGAAIPAAGLSAITDAVDIDGLLAGGTRVFIFMPLQADVTAGFKFSAGSSTSTLTNVRMDSVPNAAVVIDPGVTAVTVSDNFFQPNQVRISGNFNVFERNTMVPAVPPFDLLVNGSNNAIGLNNIPRIAVTAFGSSNQIGGPGYGNVIRNLSSASPNLLVSNNTFQNGTGTAMELSGTAGTGATVVSNLIVGYTVGVRVLSGTGHEITDNSISSVGFPIDLGNDLATPNDPAPDADVGPNDLQNFPLLTSASLVDGQAVVTGSLTSAPLTTYRIELFNGDPADPEPRNMFHSFNVTTDASGFASFTASTSASPTQDEAVVATATNLVTTDTSEVSNAVPVDAPGTLSFASNPLVVDESDGSVTIIVHRTTGSEGTVTVDFATQNGTAIAPGDFAQTSGTLTFGPGITSQTIVIPIVSDTLPEPEETFTVVLSNATGGATIGNATGTVVIASHLPPIPTASAWALIALAAALAIIVMKRI